MYFNYLAVFKMCLLRIILRKEVIVLKRKIIFGLVSIVLCVSMLGCGATSTDAPSSSSSSVLATEAPAEALTEVPTEAPHEHAYTEAVTLEATCTADGTETAKCNNCDATDTRVAEGSMLTYSYTYMDATMYAQQTVNVRSLPSTDGEMLGGLSTNDEVKVTGQCAETSWYRIEYNGQVGYVSNNYLGNDKVVVQEQTSTQTQTTTPAGVLCYCVTVKINHLLCRWRKIFR